MTCSNVRIGLLLGSANIPAWQHCLIDELIQQPHVSIDVFIYSSTNKAVCVPDSGGRVFKLFEARDYRSGQPNPDAMAATAIGDLPEKVGAKRVLLDEDVISPEISKPILKTIRDMKLDIILALGNLPFRASLRRAARLGVWLYWHDLGQTDQSSGSHCGFWEVIQRRPYIRSALIIDRKESEELYVAANSYSGIDWLSHTRSRNEHLWKILYLAPRAISRLSRLGFDGFFDSLDTSRIAGLTLSESENRSWFPSDFRVLRNLFGYTLWRAKRKIERKLFNSRWIILYSKTGEKDALQDYLKLLPPAGRFWADPHIYCHEGAHYVFFEDASVETGHGHISFFRIEEHGQVTTPRPLLERPYHLSYPFVFEWQQATYLIPESAANKTVELYRFVEFPHRVEFVKNLMEGVAAFDATLFEHDGRWWMFANLRARDGASSWDELHLFHAESPVSDNWIPHVLNPVVSDVRSARPAGSVYKHADSLIRPSQDSSYRYGYAIRLNRIIELTPERYREEHIRDIKPDWSRSIQAVHTLNESGNLIVVDAIHRSLRVGQRLTVLSR